MFLELLEMSGRCSERSNRPRSGFRVEEERRDGGVVKGAAVKGVCCRLLTVSRRRGGDCGEVVRDGERFVVVRFSAGR